jgi:hypothetical protein
MPTPREPLPDPMTVPTSRRDAKRDGVRYYFTGIPCGGGHVSLRSTSTGHCLECAKSYRLSWYYKNAESAKEAHRRWTRENMAYCVDQAEEWKRLNPEKARASEQRKNRGRKRHDRLR